RKSHGFLISVGPFMDEWGKSLGESDKLDFGAKAEIVTALFDGFKREKEAFGYARAFGSLVRSLPEGLKSLEAHLPFDLVADINKSEFLNISKCSKAEFEKSYIERLSAFEGPVSKLRF